MKRTLKNIQNCYREKELSNSNITEARFKLNIQDYIKTQDYDRLLADINKELSLDFDTILPRDGEIAVWNSSERSLSIKIKNTSKFKYELSQSLTMIIPGSNNKVWVYDFLQSQGLEFDYHFSFTKDKNRLVINFKNIKHLNTLRNSQEYKSFTEKYISTK